MMVISFFAEFIANDKPLVLEYEGEIYFPVLFSYPETEFGECLKLKQSTDQKRCNNLSKMVMGGWFGHLYRSVTTL